MSLERSLRQCFVAGLKMSSRLAFESHSVAPVKIVVVLASNGSDDPGEDGSPGVRERKPRPGRPPNCQAAKAAPSPPASNNDCEDCPTRLEAVLR